jgi:hypothetical protein
LTPLATAGVALDDAPVIPEVEGLAADERGVVFGLLRGGEAASGLAGRSGERCRAALAAVRALPPDGRAAERAALAAEIAAPLPAGLSRVHPGWLRRVLEAESSDVVRAAARGAPAGVARIAADILEVRDEPPRRSLGGPRVADVQRAVFAALAPMPAAGSGPPLSGALCALTCSALIEELDRRGATALGHAVAGAPDAVVARAAAGAGPELAPILLAAARGGVTPEARAEARALAAGASPRTTRVHGAVRAVGLRAVARAVAPEGEAALAAVAQSLPPALGDALLASARPEAR